MSRFVIFVLAAAFALPAHAELLGDYSGQATFSASTEDAGRCEVKVALDQGRSSLSFSNVNECVRSDGTSYSMSLDPILVAKQADGSLVYQGWWNAGRFREGRLSLMLPWDIYPRYDLSEKDDGTVHFKLTQLNAEGAVGYVIEGEISRSR